MMRKVAKAALLAIAVATSALAPAHGQFVPPSNSPPVTIVTRGAAITPLGWFVMGSVACAAVSPMIGTVILGRELTIGEAYHTTLGCLLGPPGWLLADALFPPTAIGSDATDAAEAAAFAASCHAGPSLQYSARRCDEHLSLNEVLLEFAAGTTAQTRDALARTLQLTQLETQTFALTGRTIERWRIDGTRSARNTLQLVSRNFPGVSFGQANMIYHPAQAPPAPKPAAAPDGASAQYVVQKLHLAGSSSHQQRRRCPGGGDRFQNRHHSSRISLASSRVNMMPLALPARRMRTARPWPAQLPHIPSWLVSRRK